MTLYPADIKINKFSQNHFFKVCKCRKLEKKNNMRINCYFVVLGHTIPPSIRC